MASVKYFFITFLLILTSSMGFSAPKVSNTGFIPSVIKKTNLVDGAISIADEMASRQPNKTVVLFHSCNLQHAMGDAAGAVKDAMPAAGKADEQTPHNDTRHLGGWSAAEMKTPKGNKFIVLNLYTQQYGGHVDDAQTHLHLIEKSLENLADQFPAQDTVFVYPEISGGVAGRKWKQEVKPRVDKALGQYQRYEIEWDKSTSKTPKLQGKVINQYQPEKPIVTSLDNKRPAKLPKTPTKEANGLQVPIEPVAKVDEEQQEQKWYQTKIAKAAGAASAIALITAAIGFGIHKFSQNNTPGRQG